MVKSREEVIAVFNETVNMTVEELQDWLNNPASKTAGTGVGLESGHKIIEILKKNPTKDPDGYDEEDLEHMRKVASYNKRHLAQEDHLKDTKTEEELEKTKSTISLRNWGHNPLKTLRKESESETESSGEEATAKTVEEKEQHLSQKRPKQDESAGDDNTVADDSTSKRDAKRKHDKIEASADEEDSDDDTSGDSEHLESLEEGEVKKKRKMDKEEDMESDESV
ncbi:hypothetical protein ABKN59_011604 [Abortiporus biennis]